MALDPIQHEKDLRQDLRDALERRHGPLMGGDDLSRALGHNNTAALRMARRRGHVAVPLFTLPKRRGLFALTCDVASWLNEVRARAANKESPDGGKPLIPPP